MSKTIKLPSGEFVQTYELILPDGHFTWLEVTKDGTRIPETIEIEKSIYEAAKMMEWVRYELGSYPLHVTSWYRPPNVNRSVGGVSNSRHLFGDGVDFFCNHLTPNSIYNRLKNKWKSGGLHAYKTFVHIDKRGHKARW